MRQSILSESELAFAEIVWENAPIRSGELVKLCEERLGWKKSTTYTVLRNLCQAGIFENENAVVAVKQTKSISQARARRLWKTVLRGRFPNSSRHLPGKRN